MASSPLEIAVEPRWPLRLPRRGGGDGTMRSADGVITRFLHVGDRPVIAHVWQRRSGEIALRAVPGGEGVDREALEVAVARMRFAFGVDDDLSDFFAAFKRDPLLGPALARRPWVRPRRRPWPWEALAWAITAQLIESGEALAIQRRIVRRWGPEADAPATIGRRRGPLRDVPTAEMIARSAPAELAACGLAPRRALAMLACAREVAGGHTDLTDPGDDRRLLTIRDIGPWTIQCLGIAGRGDPDSLPAGDLAYVKLVGRLAGLRRRATVEEVEEYFKPYAPYRGLAGVFALSHYHLGIEAGPPLRLAA
jgi:3-methyladenine DNA glycosylase/8-oxoguanine DNA glycosylase